MSGANIKTIYDLVRKAAEPLAGTARALGDRRAARNIPDRDLHERLEKQLACQSSCRPKQGELGWRNVRYVATIITCPSR